MKLIFCDVFCGYCEEACPVDAVRMGPGGKHRGFSWIQVLTTTFST
ncbi:MAG: 4Fe-4S binding protein [Bdellovibrionales bacterium]